MKKLWNKKVVSEIHVLVPSHLASFTHTYGNIKNWTRKTEHILYNKYITTSHLHLSKHTSATMLPRNLIKTIKTINIHRLTSFQPTSKAYITNIPTTRTYTTKNGSFSSKEILITEQDVIDDFTNPSIFQQNLTNDIQQWKQDDTKAAWIHLKGSKLATLLPSAMEAGFTLHHAKDDKIALCKWLDETVPNKIPPYAVSSF